MGVRLTPDTGDGTLLCRRLRFRAEYAGYITHQLKEMVYPSSWEQFGTATVSDAVEAMADMYIAYENGGDTCLIGTIVPYITQQIPVNCIPCDGATYLRVDYPDLWEVLDATWKTDFDHFVTPDLRGRTLIGAGNGPGLTGRLVGESGGEEAHQLTEAEMPSHSHFEQDPGSVVVQSGAPSVALADPGLPSQTGSTGGDQAHNNMMPYLALSYAVIAR